MSLIELKDYRYSDNEQKTFRGTRKELMKQIDKGYHVISEEQGMYIIKKTSKAEVDLEIEGKIETFDVKEIIRKEYGRRKITVSLFEKLIKDIKNGDKIFYFSKEHELSIK